MKSKTYFTYCPVYLTKDNSDPDMVAIVEIEHNVEEETVFINNYVMPIISMRNIAAPNINNSTIKTTSNYRKIYSLRYKTREIHHNTKVLLIRLAILKIIGWSGFIWEAMHWRYNENRYDISGNFSALINQNGDYLTFTFDSEINDTDLDILTNIGNIPIVKLNRLSIKEFLISFWKRHTTRVDC